MVKKQVDKQVAAVVWGAFQQLWLVSHLQPFLDRIFFATVVLSCQGYLRWGPWLPQMGHALRPQYGGSPGLPHCKSLASVSLSFSLVLVICLIIIGLACASLYLQQSPPEYLPLSLSLGRGGGPSVRSPLSDHWLSTVPVGLTGCPSSVSRGDWPSSWPGLLLTSGGTMHVDLLGVALTPGPFRWGHRGLSPLVPGGLSTPCQAGPMWSIPGPSRPAFSTCVLDSRTHPSGVLIPGVLVTLWSLHTAQGWKRLWWLTTPPGWWSQAQRIWIPCL